jgi:hypothetical protein
VEALSKQSAQKEDPSKVDVEVASALARLVPRALQDTFPQPSPRDLKLNFHLIYSILHNNLKYGRLNRENLGALYSRYVAIWKTPSQFTLVRKLTLSPRSKKHL